MTVSEFEELCTYWVDHPPVHILVAAFMGHKPQTDVALPTPEDPPWRHAIAGAQLLSVPGMQAGEPDPYPAPIWDFDALMRETVN